MRLILTASVIGLLLSAPVGFATSNIVQLSPEVAVQSGGGAECSHGPVPSEPCPALYGNGGDLMGWRNVQGGRLVHDAAGNVIKGQLNLDLGAGSTEHPGNIVLNWDVGRSTQIYDGQKRLIASFSPRGVTVHRPMRFAGPAKRHFNRMVKRIARRAVR